MDLEAHIRSIVREEIAKVVGTESATVYTSLVPPRNESRRTFREACRSGRVVGAVKNGKVWSCTREAWHAARSRRPTPTLHAVAPLADDEAIAERALAIFRPTKRSA